MAEVVIFVQVLAQKVQLGTERSGVGKAGHVGQIDPAHLQLHAGGQLGLVEFSIAGHIMVPGLFGAGVVDAVIGPCSIHVGIVGVGRPSSLVVGVVIGTEVT